MMNSSFNSNNSEEVKSQSSSNNLQIPTSNIQNSISPCLSRVSSSTIETMASDNIKVVVRVRPFNEHEQKHGSKKCIELLSEESLEIGRFEKKQQYSFDHIASDKETQEALFHRVALPIASSCLQGYNGCIFAYGQTGSGKTYTVQGPSFESERALIEENRGLLQRSFEYIFNELSNFSKKSKGHQLNQSLVKCCYYEIYNEQIMDLLDPNSGTLETRMLPNSEIIVQGLQEQVVTSLEDVIDLIKRGAKNRHIGSTLMNSESSRSHSIFTTTLQLFHKSDETTQTRTSKFHIVDLAGSERQKDTGATGDRLKEAAQINKSLSTLGRVINSLVERSQGKDRFIHYRDSKLTHLLMDSLGGNSKTLVVANISPSAINYGETLSTLGFAQRAKLIKNQAHVNESVSGSIEALQKEIELLKRELLLKDKQLHQKFGPEMVDQMNLLTMSNPSNSSSQGSLNQDNLLLLVRNREAYSEKVKDYQKVIEQYKLSIANFQEQQKKDSLMIKFRNSTIQQLKDKFKDFKSVENQELIEENKRLHESINHSNPKIAKLLAENEDLKMRVKSLESELNGDEFSQDRELQDAYHLVEQLRQALQKYENDENIEFNRNEIDCLTQEVDEGKAKIECLETELKTQGEGNQKIISALQEQLTSQLSSQESLVTQMEQISTACKCWEQKVIDYDKRYKTLKEEYLSKSSDSSSELQRLQGLIVTLEEQSSTLSVTLAETEANLERKDKELKDEIKIVEEQDEIEKEIRDQLKDTQTQLKEAKEEFQAAQRDNSNLQRQLDEVQDELSVKLGRISKQDDLVKEYQQEFQRLKEERNQIFEEKSSMEGDQIQMQLDNKNLIAEIEFTKEELAQYKSQKDTREEELQIQINSKDEEISKLKASHEDQNSSISALKNQINELQNKQNELEVVKKENQSLIEELNNKITQTAEEKEEFIQTISNLEDNIQKKSNELDHQVSNQQEAGQSSLHAIEELKATHASELQTYQQLSNQLQQQLEDKNVLISKLEKELAATKESVDSLNKKIDALQQEKQSDHQEQTKNLDQQICLKEQNIQELESKIHQQEQEGTKLQKESEDLKSKISSLASQLEGKQKVINSLQSNEEAAQLQNELQKVKTENKYIIIDLEKQLEQKKSQLIEFHIEIEKLNNNYEAASEGLNNKDNEIADLSERIIDLEMQFQLESEKTLDLTQQITMFEESKQVIKTPRQERQSILETEEEEAITMDYLENEVQRLSVALKAEQDIWNKNNQSAKIKEINRIKHELNDRNHESNKLKRDLKLSQAKISELEKFIQKQGQDPINAKMTSEKMKEKQAHLSKEIKESKAKFERTLNVALATRMIKGVISENLMLAQIQEKDLLLLKSLVETDKQFDRLKMQVSNLEREIHLQKKHAQMIEKSSAALQLQDINKITNLVSSSFLSSSSNGKFQPTASMMGQSSLNSLGTLEVKKQQSLR